MAKLIVMCGLPGSGTSTIAKLYEKYEDYTRVCLDDFRVQLFDDIICRQIS